jgi:hypothetical protein
MNPKASLKSLNVKVRAIASRPGVSVHPGNPVRADFRASADSRSTMIAFLPFDARDTLTPNPDAGSMSQRWQEAGIAMPVQDRAGVAVRPLLPQQVDQARF